MANDYAAENVVGVVESYPAGEKTLKLTKLQCVDFKYKKKLLLRPAVCVSQLPILSCTKKRPDMPILVSYLMISNLLIKCV